MSEGDREACPPPEEESEEDKRKREIADQSRQMQAKYGVSQPKKSDLLQKHLARGGRQYWDSGEYNASGKKAKDILTGTNPAVTPGRAGPSQPLVRKLSGGQNSNLVASFPPSPTGNSPPAAQLDLV